MNFWVNTVLYFKIIFFYEACSRITLDSCSSSCIYIYCTRSDRPRNHDFLINIGVEKGKQKTIACIKKLLLNLPLQHGIWTWINVSTTSEGMYDKYLIVVFIRVNFRCLFNVYSFFGILKSYWNIFQNLFFLYSVV